MKLQSPTPRQRYISSTLIAPIKYMRYAIFGALFLFSVPAGVMQAAQTAAAPAQAAAQFVSVSGTITEADAGAKTFTVKTDKGDAIVKYDDKTSFMRIAPGETDMKKASPIQKGDVSSGDRVLARIRSGESASSVPATRIFVITKDELAKRDEKVQEDWASRSLTGIVKSVDPAAKQIVMQARGPQGQHDVTVDASGKVTFRRYNPESTKASDMKMSSIGEILPGDQLRVLGEKNEDQTKVTAESLVSGEFRTMGVVVKSVDVAAGTITGTDAATKKPIVVKVTADSSVRRLQPAIAMAMARQLNPNFQGGQAGAGRPGAGGPGGASGGPGGPGGAGPGAAAGPGGRGAGLGAGPGGGAGAGPGAGPGAASGMEGGNSRGSGMPEGAAGPGSRPVGMRGGRMDASKMLESQPAIQLSELKPNDALIVYGLASTDFSKLTALNVIAGAEMILTAAPKGGPDPLGGSWNFGDVGAPQ